MYFSSRKREQARFFLSLSSSLSRLVVTTSRLALDFFREEKSRKTSGTGVRFEEKMFKSPNDQPQLPVPFPILRHFALISKSHCFDSDFFLKVLFSVEGSCRILRQPNWLTFSMDITYFFIGNFVDLAPLKSKH